MDALNNTFLVKEKWFFTYIFILFSSSLSYARHTQPASLNYMWKFVICLHNIFKCDCNEELPWILLQMICVFFFFTLVRVHLRQAHIKQARARSKL